MRRVVSVWFPHWPTDRLRRHLLSGEGLPENFSSDVPLVTARHNGRRRVIVAVDQVAASLSLQPGMAVAQALLIMPKLQIMEPEPKEDQEALQRLARWCHRITPLASVSDPDGMWLDVTGCTHLFRNEAFLLNRLAARFRRDGLQAHIAIADTPGAAHAMARYAAQTHPAVIASGKQGNAVAELPVAALRLPAELVTTLQRLGFEQVGHLFRIPRAVLARRFAPLLSLRLDQLQGRVQEPLVALVPDHMLQGRVSFVEPFLTTEAFETAIERLVAPVCAEMEHQGLGARQLDLLFERVDAHVAAIRIGTARPSRNVRHLVRLLHERLDTVDPGLGVEAMRLIVSVAEPLEWEQQDGGATSCNIAPLVDRLVNRLGHERVYSVAPRDSAFPERSVCRSVADFVVPEDDTVDLPEIIRIVAPASTAARTSRPVLISYNNDLIDYVTPKKATHLRLLETISSVEEPPIFAWRQALEPPGKAAGLVTWPVRLRVPARLLEPPRPVEALAALPNQSPIVFTWRRRRHRIRRAEGPERIRGEWWRHNSENRAVRDYFQVEDENGRRFWLFRQGDGVDLRSGNLSWFLHGLF